MKNQITILFFLIGSLAFTQSDNDSLLQEVKTKLIQDTIAYKQFLFLGRCSCNEHYAKKKNQFDKTFTELSWLNFPLPQFIDKDSTMIFFETYNELKIESKKRELSKKDETFFERPNLNIICESIYQYKSLSDILFVDFIMENKFSTLDIGRANLYLTNQTFNSDYW